MALSRLLLDVGHGPNNTAPGKYDPGAVSPHGREYEICLQIATAAREKLDGLIPTVIAPELSISALAAWTRDEWQAGDYLLSLHMNSFHAIATGTEVIYSGRAVPRRRVEAAMVSKLIAQMLGLKDRGAKKDTETPKGKVRGLPILRDTKPPALLIELGFVNNPLDVAAVLRRGADALVRAALALGEM